jgi:DNA-binding NtrC family response regulator
MDKKKILIVDDEEIIREFLSEVLQDEYNVSTVTDGDEAIELLNVTSFDLVITDLKMERVQGEEVVKFALDNNPDSKVIVISGYSSLYSVSQSVNSGAFAFLSKPFSIKELMKTVTAAVN